MAAFDPATIRLLGELLDRTAHDLNRDQRVLEKQPKNSKSKLATGLRERIAEAANVVRDLQRLLLGTQDGAAPQPDRRTEWIADARALLDFIEATPDLPLNLSSGIEARYYPLFEDDADCMAGVDAVAALIGLTVTPPNEGRHYETEIRFGSARYRAIAVLRDYREESDAIQRLGRAALAQQNARAEGGAS